MRTITKIVLVIIIITLVYSVVKLINASTTPQEQTIATITLPVNQPTTNMQNNRANMPQNKAMQPAQNVAPAATVQKQNTATSQNTQATYQADEILIDGQGQAGQNYIDITSDTPITPQQQEQKQNTQNTQNNNGGGAYAEASVSINNNRANTNTQTYAPGVPAFEVIDGN